MEAALPAIPYVNINLTMPRELWHIFQQNRHLLRDLPAVGAAAIQHWVHARYGARILVLIVQQTFGGLLTFHPHLHILVSAGGLEESAARWIDRLRFDKSELMRAWRYALIAYMAAALKAGLIKRLTGTEDIKMLFEAQYRRPWNIYIGRIMSKAQFLRYAGRYIRRPPIAQYRLQRTNDREVEYLAKDTRGKSVVKVRYSNEDFVKTLMEHVPDKFRHSMRYFGLLAPRSKHNTFSGLLTFLRQDRRPRPLRMGWANSLLKHFGVDPLIDSLGKPMVWIGRLEPVSE